MRLSVHNVGNFAGSHEFNLAPSNDLANRMPIILFGGLNGAGKTTIFEAIKLCLYGPEVLGGVKQTDYEKYLREKIHRSPLLQLQPVHASVELEFIHSNASGTSTYEVERIWEAKASKVVESLTIKKNGCLLDDVERESWQDFVKEIIPLGLSQLFFFDGEKIQKMMANGDNAELRQSIYNLLGLDVVERLQTDLKIYRTKSLKDIAGSLHVNELALLESQKSDLEVEASQVRRQAEDLDVQIERQQIRITSYRDKAAAQGESYHRNRFKLEEQRRTLQRELDSARESLRELAAGLLPLAIASTCAKKLKRQVELEAEQQVRRATAEAVKVKINRLFKYLDSPKFTDRAGLGQEAAASVANLLKEKIRNTFSAPAAAEVDEIFGFSPRQASDLLAKIGCALGELPPEVAAVTDEFERKYRKLQRVEKDLAKVPDDELLIPVYEKLNTLNQELGALNQTRKELAEKMKSLIFKLQETERRVQSCEGKIVGSQRDNDKFQAVLQVESILEKYHRKLALLKVRQLQEEFTKLFNALHRKEDLVASVTIDPITFEVTPFDGEGNVINKGSLSSGELEIFAIAMLWALARTSGQKLPFIIDTPLARLDSMHRDNLVNAFFPYASNQVLIFSTNTEIDRGYFDQMKPLVSHVYTLEYSDQAKCTSVKSGYFWN